MRMARARRERGRLVAGGRHRGAKLRRIDRRGPQGPPTGRLVHQLVRRRRSGPGVLERRRARHAHHGAALRGGLADVGALEADVGALEADVGALKLRGARGRSLSVLRGVERETHLGRAREAQLGLRRHRPMDEPGELGRDPGRELHEGRDLAALDLEDDDARIVPGHRRLPRQHLVEHAAHRVEVGANVDSGRYHRLHLPDRHGGALLPQIGLIDLRATPPERGRFLSPKLVEAVRAAFARGEQAMLFLNRRGYAPLTLCRSCGHRMQCPNCTAWLVEHRARRELQCHHCGHTAPIPPACPACAAEHSLTAVGPGVERITEEAQALFPEARRLVMASDTLSGPLASAEAARAITAREIDLIIGTQIVAKGWHFPHLTLVGVVDADLGLSGGDLRAAERTVQLLHQVAGRAGRAEAPGQVLLQTFSPEHPVMQALLSGRLEAFMAREAAQRRPGNWPPYGRLAALIVSADTAAEADTVARDLGRVAPHGEGILVLGPAPAPLSLLRGRHRRRLLLKTRREIAVQPLLRDWLALVPVRGGVRVDVDVDPVSFL